MKRLVITIKLTVLTFFVIAQLPNKPTNLQSPNAASLGLYGEVPVSLFTGIPEISIPIFTASDKYNGFSMGLSYHAGGVRPDQHPGWVGTNWTLMVGGCISRIEKGGCDEIVSDYYIGYHANQNILDDNDLIKNNYINYDTEPDEFSFNFGNYSGKFYFDRNKKLIVKSNKTLKVTLLSGSFTNCLNLILASEIYTNNRFTKGIYNDYQLNNKLALLKNVYITNSDNTLKNNYQCNNFDSFGNPLFVSINNTENATYLWSYNGEYPIAEVKNASYTDVKAALRYNDSQMENLSANSNPDVNAIRAKLDSYFANKQALITSYTYKPLTGMASAKDPRGVTTRYFYDSFGRLSLTKDQNLNIDKSYKYAYYNTDTSSTNTEIEPLTISISKSDATYINTPTTASATVTGGTGNLGFNWYLKNSSGTIIQNALDISSQFNFTCLSTGTYTLQVDVTDYLSGEVLSTTKPINCVYPPLVVSQIIGGPGYLMTTPPYNAYYYSASVTISGGSPSKYCTWRLFDSYPNGNLINTSTASSTFTGTSASWSLYSAPYSTTQTLVLQVRDNILGQTITVTKIMVKQ